jgi:hypothetical protein
MKYLVFASLALFALLISVQEASAVVCAKGVYRAGCAGPRGAVVAHRAPYGRGVYMPRLREIKARIAANIAEAVTVQ